MLTKPLSSRFSFRRAATPLLISASLLAGCSTTRTVETNLDSCLDTYRTETKPITSASPVKVDTPTHVAVFSTATNLGYNPSCAAAARAVRMGLVKNPETGDYSAQALRTLQIYMQKPDLDPVVITQIKLRLGKEHGLTPEDLRGLEKAQRAKDQGVIPPAFSCKQEGAARRCRDAVPTVPAVQ